MSKPSGTQILRVELMGIEPLIWRRLRVPDGLAFKSLHGVLQVAMGWQNCHLHEFRVGATLIGMTDQPELELAEDVEAEGQWTVAQLLAAHVEEFEYVYDFGDDWRHRIVLEPAARARVAGSSVLCLAGEGACPPEEVGGASGYAQFVEALADPAHVLHQSMADWVGEVWDIRGFDLNRVNRELRAMIARPRDRRRGGP